MKKIILLLMSALILFISCAEQNELIGNEKIEIINNITKNGASNHTEKRDPLVYDITNDTMASGGNAEECKIHSSIYHSFDPLLLQIISEEDFYNFVKKYSNSPNPPDEEYNQMQLIWDCGITPEQIDEMIETLLKNIGYDEEWLHEIYTEDQIKAMKMSPDEDIDFVNYAWKNESAIYIKGHYYTYDWLKEHTAEDYLKENLPIEQIEQIINYRSEFEDKVELVLETDKYKELLEKADGTKLEENTEQPAIGYDVTFECAKHPWGFHLGGENFPLETLLTDKENEEVSKEFKERYVSALERNDKCVYTIAELFQEYEIPREELEKYIETTNDHTFIETFTKERIDALYSGDEAKINEAWCDTYSAFFHEGVIYDIWEVFAMTPGQVKELALPYNEIKRLCVSLSENSQVTATILRFLNRFSKEELFDDFLFTTDELTKLIDYNLYLKPRLEDAIIKYEKTGTEEKKGMVKQLKKIVEEIDEFSKKILG